MKKRRKVELGTKRHKIDQTEKDWKNRINQAIKILTPIATTKLSTIKGYDREFDCIAEAPNSFKDFQIIVKAQIIVLKTIQEIL